MKVYYSSPVLQIIAFDFNIVSQSFALGVSGAGDDNAGYDLDWYE